MEMIGRRLETVSPRGLSLAFRLEIWQDNGDGSG